MLNQKQQEIFEKAVEGKNLFITGSAGVGKSYLVNEIVNRFHEDGKRVIICASTGIAARTIGGYTLHHQFHIDIIKDEITDSKKNDWIKTTDLIVIDEISMISFHLFNKVGREIMAHNPKCQLIVIGDFFQLPPVITETTMKIIRRRGYSNVKEDECHCFHSKYWKEFGFETCVLTEAMRQEDQKFSTALYNLSRGALTDEDRLYLRKAQQNPLITDDDVISLCCTNKLANQINNDKLNEIKGKEFVFKAKTWGKYDSDAAPKELKVKIGAKVMILVNNTEEGYCNGDLGFITEINDNSITVELINGGEVAVEPYKFCSYIFEGKENKIVGYITQFPIKLAWAITVHKSQGQTFNKVNFLYKRGHFEGAPQNLSLLYVGMSRAKSIENLHLEIETAIPAFYNRDVLNFYLGNYKTYISDYDRTVEDKIGF